MSKELFMDCRKRDFIEKLRIKYYKAITNNGKYTKKLISKNTRKRMVKNKVYPNRNWCCAICWRVIEEQNIVVGKRNINHFEYVCVCQLYRYIDGKHQIFISNHEWDYRYLISQKLECLPKSRILEVNPYTRA